ncbi:transporter substrate-binding domain-containing protein [Lactobacillus sp. S2-2]|uniref:transporter substrate-binding domain-containing protein n=1 Tax=Lactobacillus sp. S2-2 TaxID=2692917 RepID=UPI001F2FE9B9|nr:transporter substrate-binding domain-containing protein [Lactobacillus sp. S2-2]
MKKFNFKIIGIILLMMGFIGTYQTVSANSDTSLQKVQQKGEIVMGTAADYPPFEFKKTINSTTKMYGTDVMLGQRIAKNLGVKLKIKTMPFDSLIVGMQTGKIDMILAGMDTTPEIPRNVNFSIDYYDDPNIIVTTSDGKNINNKTNLKGVLLGAQTGSMQYNLAKKQKNIDKLTGFETNNNIILALKSKKID